MTEVNQQGLFYNANDIIKNKTQQGNGVCI